MSREFLSSALWPTVQRAPTLTLPLRSQPGSSFDSGPLQNHRQRHSGVIGLRQIRNLPN